MQRDARHHGPLTAPIILKYHHNHNGGEELTPSKTCTMGTIPSPPCPWNIFLDWSSIYDGLLSIGSSAHEGGSKFPNDVKRKGSSEGTIHIFEQDFIGRSDAEMSICRVHPDRYILRAKHRVLNPSNNTADSRGRIYCSTAQFQSLDSANSATILF